MLVSRREFLTTAAAGLSLAGHDNSLRAAAPDEPEFVFDDNAARAVIGQLRQTIGSIAPPAFRLEGQLRWQGASPAPPERWGLSMAWPDRYQQRNADRVHTLVEGRYRTNGEAGPALREVAHSNVQMTFDMLAILLLGRPASPGHHIRVNEASASEHATLTIAGRDGGHMTLLIEPAGGRRLIRPWSLASRPVDRQETVREQVRIGGLMLPSRIELQVGPHRGDITVQGEAGGSVLRDFA